jgi:ubiquinone/menaquinone biosynthesis C-methylase UbiE
MPGIFEKKQQDWDRQAFSSEDPGAQVARPGSADAIDRLVSDIAYKLDTSAASFSILDVGCGNGLVLSKLAKDRSKVAGVDYSRAMIDRARALVPNGSFSVGEAQSLPFSDGEFERVLCYSIFHYFPNDEYAVRAIAELVRVCAPGGVVLVGDLLDQSCEQDIKGKSNLDYEEQIPLIHRYSEWRFYDLDWLASQAPDRVQKTEILLQPSDFALSGYRKDLRLCL